MDDKKYQIFVSSTYKDLIETREAVVKTVLSLYHVPIGMEMFSADDAEQWEIISETISTSDYYVVIIGHRYGSETSEGISFTEKEYDYARQLGIPVLAFIRKRDVATKPEERDDAPDKVKKLHAFIDKATTDKMCDYWETTDELAKKVAIALPKSFRRNPRIGWVRADKAASPAITEELAMLSKENRDLREDYERLKATITDSKPSLSILLNGEKQISLKYKEIDFSKHIITYPQKIDYSQIAPHLKPYISSEEVEEYNTTLPPNKIIDIYNARIEQYYRFKKAGQKLVVSVSNDGTSKANEVYIEIEFPEQVDVIERDDFMKSMPDSPMPDSPIQKAEDKFKREQAGRNSQVGIGAFSAFAEMERSLASLPNIQSLMSKTLPDYSIWVSENVIHIRINGLLHTRKRQFDDNIIIAALTEGDYIARASIICAEYKTKEIFEIPIKVTKG